MRMIPALALTLAVSVGEAQASSIVSIEDVDDGIGPSIVIFDETADGSQVETQEVDQGSTVILSSVILQSPSITVLSEPAGEATPSIVLLGGTMPGPTEDAIGNISPPDTRVPGSMALMPMVIRGGIVGDALMRPAPSATSQSGPQPTLALDPNDRGTPAKRKALKRQAEKLRAIEAAAPKAAPMAMPETE